MWKHVHDFFLTLFVPTTCTLCTSGDQDLCTACLSSLSRNIENYVPPLPVPIYAPYSYRDTGVRTLLKRAKYRYGYRLYTTLSQALVSLVYKEHIVQKDTVLVPIPMSMFDTLRRGRNHASVIATIVGRELSIPVIPLLSARLHMKHTSHIKKKSDRYSHMKGLFSFSPPQPRLSTTTPIILVDDIITSGATMNEAYRVLTKNGFTVVACISIAH